MKRFKGWRHKWHHWKRLELRLFQLFSDNLAIVLDLLILNDKHNVRSLSLNIKLICSLWNRIEKLAKDSRLYRFIKLVQINHCTCIVFLTYQCFRTDDGDYDVKMTFFFSYVIARPSYNLMRWWWWGPLCTRPTCWVGFE